MKLCTWRLCRKQIIVAFYGEDNCEYCCGQCWKHQLEDMQRSELWLKTHKNPQEQPQKESPTGS